MKGASTRFPSRPPAGIFAAIGLRAVAIALLCPAWSLAADQKLILTDGTDQLVRSYEVVGARVRYYSAERQQWEELPASLVDWEATEKAKQEAEQNAAVELEPDPSAPEASEVFEAAPGVPLPEGEGAYVYDGKTVLGLLQSLATMETDVKRTILGALSPLPVVKGRSWIKLDGRTAKVSVTGSTPVFYLQLSQPFSGGYGLVRLKAQGDSRLVGQVLTTPITGETAESQDVVPAAIVEVESAKSDGKPSIVKVTPREPLQPGEYAIVSFLAPGDLNLFVWDFSVRPAPAAQPGR